MTRVSVNPQTLRVNVRDLHNMIEQDIVNNAKEVTQRYNYYTTKYRGDLLNDVNVGIFLDDDYRMAIQIYVSNGITSMQSKLKLSKDLKRISTVEQLKYKNMFIEKQIPQYDNDNNTTFQSRLDLAISEALSEYKGYEYAGKELLKISYPDSNGITTVQIPLV